MKKLNERIQIYCMRFILIKNSVININYTIEMQKASAIIKM